MGKMLMNMCTLGTIAFILVFGSAGIESTDDPKIRGRVKIELNSTEIEWVWRWDEDFDSWVARVWGVLNACVRL